MGFFSFFSKEKKETFGQKVYPKQKKVFLVR